MFLLKFQNFKKQCNSLNDLELFFKNNKLNYEELIEKGCITDEIKYKYENFILTIQRIREMNDECNLALSNYSKSSDWIKKYRDLFESLFLSDFSYEIEIQNNSTNENFIYYGIEFDYWIIKRDDLLPQIHFIKIYPIMSDFYQLDSEIQIDFLLKV